MSVGCVASVSGPKRNRTGRPVCHSLPGLTDLSLRFHAFLSRFHSSKSGKVYLHDNIRLLFSRKSIEIDSGIPYELKSFTELPRNPCYSPRA